MWQFVTTPESRHLRLQYVMEHVDWDQEQWGRVLWSNESRISMDGKDGGAHVWRLSFERFDPDCVVTTRQWSPGLLMWGCFAEPGLGQIINIDGTLNGNGYKELIEQHVYPTMLAM